MRLVFGRIFCRLDNFHYICAPKFTGKPENGTFRQHFYAEIRSRWLARVFQINLVKNKKMKKTERVSVIYMILSVVFCVCLVSSNIFVAKVTTYGFTGGLLVFPISYIIGDVTTEVYGFRAVRRLIWLGFAMNFFVVAMGALVTTLPGNAELPSSAAIDTIFRIDGGMALIVCCASMLSFVLGSMANAWVMHRMHQIDGERRFSLRAIVSTIAGEGVDSLIFFPIAFGMPLITGEMPVVALLKMMALQVSLKTIYEVIALPVTIRVVRYVEGKEEQSMAGAMKIAA